MQELRLRQEGVAWSDLGSEIVILDLRTSTYFTVQGTGALLISALVTGACPAALVERILDAYDTTAATARADVDDFLDELSRRDLIEPVC